MTRITEPSVGYLYRYFAARTRMLAARYTPDPNHIPRHWRDRRDHHNGTFLWTDETLTFRLRVDDRVAAARAAGVPAGRHEAAA